MNPIRKFYHKRIYPLLYKKAAPLLLAQSKRIYLEEQALNSREQVLDFYLSDRERKN